MFDPYRKWLGILPKDQPPNYYRLLSIELFESDLDVIEGAADRLMGFVRHYQSGEHAADAARILNELSVARLCLLKESAKAAYDEKLRKELVAANPEPEPSSVSQYFSSVDVGPEIPSRSRRKKVPPKAHSERFRLVIGGGIAVLGCLVVAVFLMSGRGRTTAETGEQVPVTEVTPSTPAGAPTATQKHTTSEDAMNSTSPVESVPETGESATAARPEVNLKSQESKVARLEQKVDLLSRLDLGSDVHREYYGRKFYYLPTAAPDEYTLSMTVELGKEEHYGLVVGLVTGATSSQIWFEPPGVGLELIDGKGWDQNATSKLQPLIKPGVPARIDCTVTRNRVRLDIDGQTVFDWQGDFQRLSPHDPWALPDRKRLSLGISESLKLFTLELGPALAPPGTPTPDQPEMAWLQKRTPNAKALLIIPPSPEERDAAMDGCRAARLPFDLVADFPGPGFDYKEYSLIVTGTNVMEYWAREESRKAPAAFQSIIDFVSAGGHLLVFNSWNGNHMEHLRPFGIHASYYHTNEYRAVPGATEILFNGVESLVPEGTYLKQSGNFRVEVPHKILMRRGIGSLENEPTIATLRHGAGRVTYTSVEPGFGEPCGFWMVHVLTRWAGRGGPLTTKDLAEANAEFDKLPKPKGSRRLIIQEAKHHVNGQLLDLTPAITAATRSGLLAIAVDTTLPGGNQGGPRHLYLRYKLDDVEESQVVGENRGIVVDGRAPVFEYTFAGIQTVRSPAWIWHLSDFNLAGSHPRVP
ncbi:MAG: hypothetical protein JSS49_01005 [Planctomycetes bacterium]|nr:hypothetical protein [Planctomycetota bacterium]